MRLGRGYYPVLQKSSKVTPTAFDFGTLPAFRWIQHLRNLASTSKTRDPFFKLHDGNAGALTSINGQTVINFGSYDYLSLSNNSDVKEAAKAAIDKYGTSVSASRLIAGERPIHRDLEERLAALHETDAALAFVSGHATNVTVLGQLLGKRDLLVVDSLIHNSILEGGRLSGATILQFPHNDVRALDALLSSRSEYERALIVAEGVYSMDGDCCDLRRLIEIKERHKAWLMIDEAHSIGVLGQTGRGIAEEQGVDPGNVEIWMGTLSKAFAASGGYIAASEKLIDLLRSTAPGFVFSVGLAPSQAAAACAAIDIMMREFDRVRTLRKNANTFLELARKFDLDTYGAAGFPVIPVKIGDPITTAQLSNRLLERGFNVPPVIFPAVQFDQSRLRFFVNRDHTAEQIKAVIEALAEEIQLIKRRKL